jgi:hypothetical protein
MRRGHSLGAVLAFAAAASSGVVAGLSKTEAQTPTQAQAQAQAAAEPLREDEARDIALDAYVYGYPLVTMEMTRRVMTNTATADDKRAPVGQFAKARWYATPTDRDVAAPNADTLYTVAWLDLSKGPVVLGIPEMKDRYYTMPLLDGWTDIFRVPGKRTTGGHPQKYLLTGPGWRGRVPAGMTECKAPTQTVWILGRIYSDGTSADLAEVHTLQDQFLLVPLAAYGKPYTPPDGEVDPTIDMTTPVRDQVNRLPPAAYFGMLARLMRDNPPAEVDRPMVERMAKIGVVPGSDFNADALPAVVAKVMADVPKLALDKIRAHRKEGASRVNGWRIAQKTGDYGTDYLQRALVALVGLGANRPEDAIYPIAVQDSDGKGYEGAHKYVIHFEKGKMPPVEGFWSLTMYDDKMFLVPNSLGRYALGTRDDVKTNPDGSTDLYLQKDSPGPDKESNWLPAPSGRFFPMLRMYWPSTTPPSLLDGSWQPPPIKKAAD